MGKGLVSAALVPHPPLIIPEVGQQHDLSIVCNTIQAMKAAAGKVAASQPDTLVIVSPHGTVFRDAMALLAGDELEGSFADFGVPQVKMKWNNDLSLLNAIRDEAEAEGITTVVIDDAAAEAYGVTAALDHGAAVPLYFLKEAGLQCRLVHINYGFLDYIELFQFGCAVRRAIETSGKRVALIASGDLSHRLIKGAPAGYHPQAAQFDQLLVSLIKEYAVEEILKIDKELINAAGECAMRSFAVAFGALDGFEIKPQVLSYEGPYGVGYMIALLTISGETEPLLPKLKGEKRRELQYFREKESIYVRLARRALEGYVKNGKMPPPWQPLPDELKIRAAAFVSLKKNGALRGCIGTVQPQEKDLAREIMMNAVSAGLRDPRFPPVTMDELKQISYSVDVLSPMEKTQKEELDPNRYGVMVTKKNRSGLLLPNLEGVETIQQQTAIAKQKAGIELEDENVEYFRFEVQRYF